MKTRLMVPGETYTDTNISSPYSKTVVLQQKGGYIVQTITNAGAHSIYISGEVYQRPE